MLITDSYYLGFYSTIVYLLTNKRYVQTKIFDFF